MKTIAVAGTLFMASFVGEALAAAPAPAADRLTLMVSGSTLSQADDGGGAGIGWLHNFSPSTVLGLGGEYQTLANSEWKFGSFNFAFGVGPAAHRSNFYVEAHEGSGHDDAHSYDYSVAAAGMYQSFTRQLSLQIEDKQIDIDTTHGNLPKVGVQYLWSPKLLTALSYAHSVSGDLGTRLGTARVDVFGKHVNFILGGAGGQASPAVIDIQTGIKTPGLTMREGFIGLSKPFSRVDLTVLGDYLKIGDTERVTLTLNGTVRLRDAGGSR